MEGGRGIHGIVKSQTVCGGGKGHSWHCEITNCGNVIIKINCMNLNFDGTWYIFILYYKWMLCICHLTFSKCPDWTLIVVG